MAFVTRVGNILNVLNKTLNNGKTISTSAKSLGGAWNKDFKPAPFPETDTEKLKAAKKYHLLPAEYQPYADDGLGYGDYPKLHAGYGVENKDPYYPYDFPELRRNFHETFHVDHDLYSEDRFSQMEKPRYKDSYYFAVFIGFMAFCLGAFYWLDDKRMFRPVVPKQYPNKGTKHYTFDS